MSANLPENGQNSERKVVDAEIVEPDHGHSNNSHRTRQYRDQGGRYFNYFGIAPMYGDGCLGPAITFALFMICLGQYGLLAAIGFFVFYTVGSVIGTIHAANRLMAGRPINPWAWRAGNWFISFMLTVWLAGGIAN